MGESSHFAGSHSALREEKITLRTLFVSIRSHDGASSTQGYRVMCFQFLATIFHRHKLLSFLREVSSLSPQALLGRLADYLIRTVYVTPPPVTVVENSIIRTTETLAPSTITLDPSTVLVTPAPITITLDPTTVVQDNTLLTTV
jgi:hypothetical protein